ncbi:GFA family protein [Qipengyuania sp. JC766]|uniref:GFA family protein n=1 Tax=Qipengyuania sp. JC766 TaxID=3232139 RepID=UPI0034578672
MQVVLEEAPEQVELCQCGMCRRWSGSLYSAQYGENPEVTGEASVSVYRSSDWAERAFCSACGTHLWFRFLPTGNRSFSAGLFDAAASHAIEKEIFVDEAAAWSRLQGDHPRQTGEEVIAEAKAAGFTFD